MSHERFTDGLFETRWQSSIQPEYHSGESKQSCRVGEQKSEADRMNQIRIAFFNMPVFALEVPESKPAEKLEPKNLDTQISFLDVIEIIFKMIVEGVKAIFPKQKGK
jgi:hypothetical protein